MSVPANLFLFFQSSNLESSNPALFCNLTFKKLLKYISNYETNRSNSRTAECREIVFFNAVTRYKDEIVDDSPGVTRGRHYGSASWNGTDFTLFDTGGFPRKEDHFSKEVKARIFQEGRSFR
jgi:hypothetical protein